MKRIISFAAAIVLAAVSLVGLTGCERAPEAPKPPPTQYNITLYDDGEIVRTFTGTGANANEGVAYFKVGDDTWYTQVAGTFILEAVGNPSGAERSADSKYKIELYSGKKVIRTWYAPDANANGGVGYFKVSGSTEYTQIGGTYTLELLR